LTIELGRRNQRRPELGLPRRDYGGDRRGEIPTGRRGREVAFSEQPTVIAPQLDPDCLTVGRQHRTIRRRALGGVRKQPPQSFGDLSGIRTGGRSRDRHHGMRQQQHQQGLGDHDHPVGRRTVGQ
jgi:hypothetical protein